MSVLQIDPGDGVVEALALARGLLHVRIVDVGLCASGNGAHSVYGDASLRVLGECETVVAKHWDEDFPGLHSFFQVQVHPRHGCLGLPDGLFHAFHVQKIEGDGATQLADSQVVGAIVTGGSGGEALGGGDDLKKELYGVGAESLVPGISGVVEVGRPGVGGEGLPDLLRGLAQIEGVGVCEDL